MEDALTGLELNAGNLLNTKGREIYIKHA